MKLNDEIMEKFGVLERVQTLSIHLFITSQNNAIESSMHMKTVAKNLRSKVMQSENKILSDNINYC